MENEPRSHPEIPEGTKLEFGEAEKEFYAREIQDVERKISDKKEESFELEMTVKVLGQEMAQGRLDDEMPVREALNKLAKRPGGTAAFIAAEKVLEGYKKEMPFFTLQEIKNDIAERMKKISAELGTLAEDAVRMEGTNDDGGDEKPTAENE